MIVALSIGWLAIFVGAWLGWQLLRQNGRLLLRVEELEKRLDTLEFGQDTEPEGLPVGSEARAFELPDLAGEHHTLAQYRDQPLLLIFFNPDCGFCREMMPRLAAVQKSEAGGQKSDGERQPFMLIITTGDAQKNRQLFAEHNIGCPVLLQKGTEVASIYQANGTPSGYLVDPEGKIASPLAMGADALLALATEPRRNRGNEAQSSASQLSTLNSHTERQSLLTSAATEGNGQASRFGNRSLARSRIKRDGLKASTTAPDFRLPRLDGRGDLNLNELRGKRVLLVFSSPGCGPCNALAPELEKFHRQHLELEVVMISKGEPKENRAKVKEHGLTFPIVLQQQWEISRRFAMFATPIAYLIDQAGIIAAEVAVGVEAILELMQNEARSHAQQIAMAREDTTRFDA